MVNFCGAISIVIIYVVISFIDANAEDKHKITVQLITTNGYNVETHYVTTEDGYILTVFRMPYQKYTNNSTRLNPPMLLVHGMVASSEDWLIQGPKHALGFLLADQGYDVWLMNCRGNKYSTNHTTLDTNDSPYWNFSFHEMGVYDIPATIEYITNITKQPQIIHIGHSQGCTALYIMLSERPEYNSRIKAHFGYAPAAYLCHISMMGKMVSSPEMLGMLNLFRYMVGDFNFAPNGIMEFMKVKLLCSENSYLHSICVQIMGMAFNFTPSQINKALIPILIDQYPAGSSTKQAFHYAQLINSCTFRRYKNNLFEEPALYNISNIRIPYIHLFSGKHDNVQSSLDTANFAKDLTNGFNTVVYLDNWKHCDFAFSKDARCLVYDPTINALNYLNNLIT